MIGLTNHFAAAAERRPRYLKNLKLLLPKPKNIITAIKMHKPIETTTPKAIINLVVDLAQRKEKLSVKSRENTASIIQSE